MDELLELVLNAHGGIDRWKEISRFRVNCSIGGAIWTLKGKPGLLDDIVLSGETRVQRLLIEPFPAPDRFATWEPRRQTIATAEGVLVEERDDPASVFAGQTRESLWDDLQVAYFVGEANWNYFVAPFVFARPDFEVAEGERWSENGETWRTLVVTYPDQIIAHTKTQTYYFGDDGLLRRLDYSVDILGGGPAAHYPSAYKEFDGIMVPTRRDVYVRNPDGSPKRDSLSIGIDVTQVSFD